MVFTQSDLQERLGVLRAHFKKATLSIEQEFEEHLNWLQDVCSGVKNGTINVQGVLVPKTPAKRRGRPPLHAIRESLESTIDLEEVRPKRKCADSKKERKKQKVSQISQKRPSDESDDSATSKRLCQSQSSETTSRDSGLSSVGSRITRGSTLGGVVVKQEFLSPKERSMESTFTCDKTDDCSSSNMLHIKAENTSQKRSLSTDRGTFVLKENSRMSTRSRSSPRTSGPNNETFVLTNANATFIKSPCMSSPNLSAASKTQEATLKSPAVVKALPVHLLKGESVKKAVKAFEALNEDHEAEKQTCFAPSTSTSNKMLPPAIIPSSSTTTKTSSLEDAVDAPPRVTRTKTRAMAKAAAAQDASKANASKIQEGPSSSSSSSSVSNILKSPIYQHQKNVPVFKSADKRTEDVYEKENTILGSSRFLMKPFGSTQKPHSFLKVTTPLNRPNPMTPSSSFSVPRNIVTSVESFIPKPIVHQELKPSREENLQKLAAKAEVASKKKEEIMKAQMEELKKKRQEKRLKVCATREAMEREKMEMQLKLEREREEKQRQLQAEREEKLKQEYLKKKRLALQKAAETEERRRQEEAARLAKLKQQEEEQKRVAAQRQKELEEAERKQLERLQQEREAAALQIKEAERLAKETKRPAASQSYGMTPVPEDRQPTPLANADNYGIDDVGTDDSSEDESKPKKVVPLWAQSKQRLPKLMEDYEVTLQQMFVFFESKKSTPDLSKIFTSIDRRQLLRKSSAVWRTPPVKY